MTPPTLVQALVLARAALDEPHYQASPIRERELAAFILGALGTDLPPEEVRWVPVVESFQGGARYLSTAIGAVNPALARAYAAALLRAADDAEAPP